jgi:hypothetical protein
MVGVENQDDEENPGLVVVGAFVLGAGSAPAAHAQEMKQPPDIRMLLTQPSTSLSDSPPAPDLRDLPKAKMDRPATQLPITVTLVIRAAIQARETGSSILDSSEIRAREGLASFSPPGVRRPFP